MKEKEKKPIRIACPDCKRWSVLYRAKSDSFQCRLCGCKFKRDGTRLEE